MQFTERHHAFISATFYRLLKEGNYKNFRRAFISATQKMAEQRGARMAQRAIRDGIEELDYEAYRHYGEWNWSEAYLDSVKNKKHIDEIHSDTDYAYAVYECPWADIYHEEGIAEDGGVDYCFDLDPSLVRGFNPELEYKTTQTLQTCDTCIQFQVNGKINKNKSLGHGKVENTKGFDYHCGHVYQAYFEYMIAIYGAEGLFLGAKVLECFAKKYGKEMADTIVKHIKTDFNFI
jgi:hypothetical protein